MSEKKATRAAYGEMLVELADKYPELVVLDADLAGATMTKGFAQACPDRFFDMGIAEANMIGVAAGLAACGKKTFANSFAMFTAGRAYEQVRNSCLLYTSRRALRGPGRARPRHRGRGRAHDRQLCLRDGVRPRRGLREDVYKRQCPGWCRAFRR